VLLRLTGKRSFGEMSPFDIVVLMLVGGALRSAMVGHDDSFLGPFIAVAGVLLLDKLLGIAATFRSPCSNPIRSEAARSLHRCPAFLDIAAMRLANGHSRTRRSCRSLIRGTAP
jgi:hypothetical protein